MSALTENLRNIHWFGSRERATVVEAADRIEELESVIIDHETPTNDVGATHWAVTPDSEVLFYKIGDDTLLWLAYSEVWITPGMAPYTLHPFDQ